MNGPFNSVVRVGKKQFKHTTTEIANIAQCVSVPCLAERIGKGSPNFQNK